MRTSSVSFGGPRKEGRTRRSNEHAVPAYTEAQATAWLAWLARGMQKHGQSVFLIEQLQPSWLSSPGQKRLYVAASRLIGGVCVAVIFGLLISLLLRLGDGLIMKLLDSLLFGLMGGSSFKLRFLLFDSLRVHEELGPAFELILGVTLGLILALMDVSRLGGSSRWTRIRQRSIYWPATIYVLGLGLVSRSARGAATRGASGSGRGRRAGGEGGWGVWTTNACLRRGKWAPWPPGARQGGEGDEGRYGSPSIWARRVPLLHMVCREVRQGAAPQPCFGIDRPFRGTCRLTPSTV